nr:hypothetical protein CFP56_66820 [Quercus suber]
MFPSATALRSIIPHPSSIRIRQLARIIRLSVPDTNTVQYAAVDQPDERRDDGEYQQRKHDPESTADVCAARVFRLLTGQPVRSARMTERMELVFSEVDGGGEAFPKRWIFDTGHCCNFKDVMGGCPVSELSSKTRFRFLCSAGDCSID